MSSFVFSDSILCFYPVQQLKQTSNNHNVGPADQTVLCTLQQIQPRKHRPLHRSQPEHPATVHPAGADDWRRHEELPEAEQAPRCECTSHPALCQCEIAQPPCINLSCLFFFPGSVLLSEHAGAATNGPRHRFWLSVPGREPFYPQVRSLSC